MLNTIVLALTLLSILVIVYHHVGYPLILKYVKKYSTNKVTKAYSRRYNNSKTDNELPSITIVIPAYNEEQWVAEKIRNLATLDYPKNKLAIIIACDGCTDTTVALALQTIDEPECADLKIEVINFAVNRGKVLIINDIMSSINTDLVALSDVSALVSIDALLMAAERFKSPKVGVLNGHYRLIAPGSVGEQAYWNYQSEIKSSEAALGGTLGAHGAFYIFRTHLFEPLPEDTINDDFIIPMKIVAAGYHSDYEESINALELENAGDQQDHHRRRRIAAGNFQQLLRLKALLLPRYGKTAFSFLSGKALRVFMPFLMILSLVGSVVLSFQYPAFIPVAALQLVAYLIACCEIIFKPKSSPKLCKLIAYIVGGHAAGFIGSMRYLLKLDKGRWFKFNH